MIKWRFQNRNPEKMRHVVPVKGSERNIPNPEKYEIPWQRGTIVKENFYDGHCQMRQEATNLSPGSKRNRTSLKRTTTIAVTYISAGSQLAGLLHSSRSSKLFHIFTGLALATVLSLTVFTLATPRAPATYSWADFSANHRASGTRLFGSRLSLLWISKKCLLVLDFAK